MPQSVLVSCGRQRWREKCDAAVCDAAVDGKVGDLRDLGLYYQSRAQDGINLMVCSGGVEAPPQIELQGLPDVGRSW